MSIRKLLLECLAVCLPSTFAFADATMLYVSPKGNDANPGTEEKPFASVEKARQAVRKINKDMNDDIVVVLGDGVYPIDQTLAFDADDSGTNGHNVIYRAEADATPIISGGKPVVGWEKDENGLWRAFAPVDDFRQLYVNGVRATRARGETPAGIEFEGEDGCKTTALEMADWKNQDDIEFCYAGEWVHTRCKVVDIKRDGDQAIITMLQPHFSGAKNKEGISVANWQLQHIENALELLDEPGEWYLDRKAKVIYYMPRNGEDMTKAEVIAPAAERLVELRGTLDAPVQNIQFVGISFQHGSWVLPNKIGLIDVQANFVLDTEHPMVRDGKVTAVHNELLKSPSNIVCHAAKSIRFERCVFTRLGSGAIDLEVGAQDNAIIGCHFYDISGSAVQVGDILRDDHHPDDMRKIVRNNTVANNYIHNVALEYRGGVGVFAGYTEGTVITHNEMTDLPYSAVAVGWGWGEEDAGGGAENYYMPYKYATPTPAKDNRIEFNHVHEVMMDSNDGGAIYIIGNMPGSIIRGNHIHDNGHLDTNCGGPGGIYLDEGSGFIEITGNLVYDVINPMNYNNHNQNRKDTCNEHDNFFGGKAEDAEEVVEEAGLEAEYQNLLKKP